MKKSLFFLIIIILFECCAPSTYITGSWKSPAPPAKQYNNIFVAALTNNTIAKATLENDMAVMLGKSVNVLKSIDEFPPNVSGSDSNKVELMNKVKNKNSDAILTISILSNETESRYVRGRSPYDPMIYPFYNDFWGYYSYWYPSFYSHGYYIENRVYYIETNLYDVQTEKLMWSAQSKTYNPDNLPSFSREFASVIVTKLKTDGMLPSTAKQ